MLWLYLGCVGIDVWWMRRLIPNFTLTWTHWTGLCVGFLSLELILDGWTLWRLAWLGWMAWVDHRTLHFSDFSLGLLVGLALLDLPSDTSVIWALKALMFTPYLLLSLAQERLGWGDTWVFGVMHAVLEFEHIQIWTLSTLCLALLFGSIQRSKKNPIALGPFMALAYGGLVLLG
jgi:prepilin signal peptidase PulO-like enzyme (type II secretory pathway)